MAIWVVVGHTIKNSGIFPSDIAFFSILVQPGLAVDVFIILSGFVIFFLLDARAIGYSQFIVQRFFRLAPIYYFMLVISAAVLDWQTEFIQSFAFRSPGIENNLVIHLDAQRDFFVHLVAHLLMVHGAVSDSLLRSSAYTFLGAAWSISVEWQFYLIAPSLFYFVQRSYWTSAALLVVTIVFIRSLNYAGEGFVINQAVYFLIGILSYYLWKNCNSIKIDARQVELFAVIAVCLIYLLSTRYISIAIWTLALSCIIAERRGEYTKVQWVTSRILNLRVLKWLGKISYSVYLIHMLVFYSLANVVLHQWPDLGKDGLVAVLMVAVPLATIAGSCVTFHLIERPGIAMGKRLAQRLVAP
jgi:peptidoglycan/LPS O-acetylase OafA/YrhL